MIRTSLAAAAIAVALPVAAYAVPIVAEGNFNGATLYSDSTVSTTYTADAGTAWLIEDIAFTAIGNWADIEKVTITFGDDADEITFVGWAPGQSPNSATGTISAPFVVTSSFTITYTYAPGGAATVGMMTYFDATQVEIPAVPLPAGGLLLLSALGGVAALKRRKKA